MNPHPFDRSQLPILITGGAGSVGRLLVQRFLDGGHSVRVFDLPSMDFSELEGRKDVEIIRGNVTEVESVNKVITGVCGVVHLAALLPPNSELNHKLTIDVNVGGTKNIVKALESKNPDATLVFTSSISTYGDTSSDTPPIRTDHSQAAIDVYAKSKILSETIVRSSSLKTVILRIAGIAVPEFLAPPDIWPFTPNQRIEMIHRDDVADAVFAATNVTEAVDKVFNVGGGPSWQLTGSEYVNDFYRFMGAPVEDAVYKDTPGWVDWYDTRDSQDILKYQSRSYDHYSSEMRAIVEALMVD